MARPQSPDYDKRREAMVAAAARLFARDGFNGASVADLAAAFSASKSLVYHYFPGKDDILHAVMASHLDALVEAADVAEREATPEGRLRALTRAFMALYVGAGDSHKVLLNELDNLPPARRGEVVAKQRRIIAVVERQVVALRPDADATVAAMLFFGSINWTHTWFRPGGAVTPDAVADRAVTMLLSSLQAS